MKFSKPKSQETYAAYALCSFIFAIVSGLGLMLYLPTVNSSKIPGDFAPSFAGIETLYFAPLFVIALAAAVLASIYSNKRLWRVAGAISVLIIIFEIIISFKVYAN